MAKYPRYSVVIQNVRPDCKQTVLHHVSGAKRSAVAVEPYNHQPGYHIHIFIEFPNQRYKTALLKEYQDLSTKIVAPRPEGIEGDWGRVQVDQMRGTFEQATQYLVNPTKDKAVDPDVVVSSAAQDEYFKKLETLYTLGKQLKQRYLFPNLGRICSVEEYLEDPRCDDTGYYLDLLTRWKQICLEI